MKRKRTELNENSHVREMENQFSLFSAFTSLAEKESLRLLTSAVKQTKP